MQLRSIVQSFAACMPQGFSNNGVFLPDAIEAIRRKYSFVGFPTTIEEISSSEGLKFSHGKGDGFVISSLTIFNEGAFCQASVNTDVLRTLLIEVVDTLKSVGFKVEEENFRFLFNSQLEVGSEGEPFKWLDRANPLIAMIKGLIQGYGIQVSNYDVWGITLGGEGPGDLKPGRFLLERRIGNAFAEGVYYSEAPVSTNEHWNLLRQIERLSVGS